jgi:hypothetical protein
MKKIILLLAFISTITFGISKAEAPQGKVYKNHKTTEAAQRRTARYKRMEMQLAQVRYHEEREKRADKAQREAAKAELRNQ